jgi:DNA-binding transcriptional MerR regulator
MATIAEVARLLDVDRDSVRRWATEFAEHLSLTANPKKGQERQFTEADLRVLAVIAEHFEMENDASDIHYALNSGSQYEEPFLEFARIHTPLFQEVPEEIDETWQHGVLIGGMACRDLPQVAAAYKLAADELVKRALASQEPHELDYPILFLYRHTVELYLKAALTTAPEHHDLSRLIQLFEAECGNTIADWIKDRLWDFHKIDHMSALFRYAEPPSNVELWIDFHQLQTVMDKLVQAFEEYMARKTEEERTKKYNSV